MLIGSRPWRRMISSAAAWSSGSSSVTSPPISWACARGPAQRAQQRHLRARPRARVCAVDADPVGVARVVAGGAGQVAAREHAVRALAARRVPAEHLARGPDASRQLRPAPLQRGDELRVDRRRPPLPLPQPAAVEHVWFPPVRVTGEPEHPRSTLEWGRHRPAGHRGGTGGTTGSVPSPSTRGRHRGSSGGDARMPEDLVDFPHGSISTWRSSSSRRCAGRGRADRRVPGSFAAGTRPDHTRRRRQRLAGQP